MRYLIVFSWLLLSVVPVYAGIEVHDFKTPELEERYNHLTNTLRCLVCQNESLAESNAPLAKQLREKAYEMLNNGATDKQIVDYMVQRYGDFVLYSPPLMPTTYLLWIGPFALLVIGIVIMQMILRRNRQQQPTLANPDLDKARALLSDKDNNE